MEKDLPATVGGTRLGRRHSPSEPADIQSSRCRRKQQNPRHTRTSEGSLKWDGSNAAGVCTARRLRLRRILVESDGDENDRRAVWEIGVAGIIQLRRGRKEKCGQEHLTVCMGISTIIREDPARSAEHVVRPASLARTGQHSAGRWSGNRFHAGIMRSSGTDSRTNGSRTANSAIVFLKKSLLMSASRVGLRLLI